MRCATLGPVMLMNRKFDTSCKLVISRNLSTFPSQLQKKAEVLPHSPVVMGVFDGFSQRWAVASY